MKKNIFYNEDCIEGCKRHIKDNSVDLIITDPPYGIGGDKLHKHYNRKEKFVLDGYIEIPKDEYAKFSKQWIKESERILRPGGSMYIVSGYTNLIDILNALKKTSLKEINHMIWKYNFGVHTTSKYVSSHYHILFYRKSGGKPIFNTYSRFGPAEKGDNGGSLNYQDREDVWIINREYKPGQIKNKNELPKKLLMKMVQYSSNEGDVVCDMFLGSFSTAKVAIGLNRYAIGFEKSKSIYDYQINIINNLTSGYLLKNLRAPAKNYYKNRGKPWSKKEIKKLYTQYDKMYTQLGSKKKTIDCLCKEFGRGYFSILNILSKRKEKYMKFSKIAEEIGKVLVNIPQKWDGRKSILEMKESNYPHWKQMEWIGFYFQFLCEKYLKDVVKLPGPSYGNVKFDGFRKVPWDFKAHAINTSSHKIIVNDSKAIAKAIEEYGMIGLILAVGNVVYNDDERTFQKWREHLKGGKSKYEKERIKRGAWSRKRKVTFNLKQISFIKITDKTLVNCGSFQTDFRNANGSPRKSKLLIDLENIVKELEHLVEF